MKKNKGYKILITLNSNRGELIGANIILHKLYEKYKVRHPNAFYLKRQTDFHFDGFVKYIDQYGRFNIGLLPMIVKDLKAMGCKIELEDNRKDINIKPSLVTKLGKFVLRDNQQDCVNSVINNKVEGMPFYVGVVNGATNVGKTLVMAGIHEAFKRKLKTIILLNNSRIFKQSQKEMKEYLPGEDIKWVQGKNLEFGNVTIAMVQTLAKNVKYLQSKLEKFDICLVDEADVSDNKSYKAVIQHLYNTNVRVGLSGSIYMSKLKRDLMHNMNLRSFLGDELVIITKREMMDAGYSAEVKVTICQGNMINSPTVGKSYLECYHDLISNNKKAWEFSLNRTLYNIKKMRTPCIIVVQYIKHAENLYAYYTKMLKKKYSVQMMHHKTKNGDKILEDFKEGKIDILIISFIVKRGLNLPKSQYMQNAAGSDSEETISQLMGRMERTTKDKSISYMDDLYYFGEYVRRHSKHRINFYKKHKVRVIDKVTKYLKKLE